MHRQDLGLYSHPKEFWGMESEPILTKKGKKSLLPGNFSPEEDQTQDAASSRTRAQHTTNQLFRPPSSRTASPTHYQLSYSGPHQAGQPAQHTTNQLFRPPSSRTASPTHYQGVIPAPTKQDSQPNTLPRSYSGPHQAGQPAQHTTKELFRPPSSRTASPTHYQGVIPAPYILPF